MAEADPKRKLKRWEDQERKLAFPDFSHADAWRLGTILVATAVERGLGIAIRITIGDQIAFHAGMPGSSADNDAWLERKARTVRRFGVSTMLLRMRADLVGETHPELDPARYAIAGGCIPIRTAGGALLGTVGVSGLAQADDHALVLGAMQQFLAPPVAE